MAKDKKTDQAQLCVRVGDGGEYELFGDDFDALAGTLQEARVLPPLMFHTQYGVRDQGNYDGQNYISLFWSDDDCQPIKELTTAELKDLNKRLKNLGNADE